MQLARPSVARPLLAIAAPAGRQLRVRTLAAGAGEQRSVVAPRTKEDKCAFVAQLLAAKEQSGKTFTQIASETGLTNGYAAQLFYNQAQLKPETAAKLQQAVPGITDDLVAVMQKCPLRSFDPALIQEPLIYRLYEAVMHYGEGLKALTNEEFGDGIMSAIDFYCTVDTVDGKAGEKRVVITFNGKFLPHVEQQADNNTAAR